MFTEVFLKFRTFFATKLQSTIKTYKKQIEEAEEIVALNLAKFRKAEQELDGDRGARKACRGPDPLLTCQRPTKLDTDLIPIFFLEQSTLKSAQSILNLGIFVYILCKYYFSTQPKKKKG